MAATRIAGPVGLACACALAALATVPRVIDAQALLYGQADELIRGLASVGLAITAGTYASLGAGVPARIGVTVAKAARRAGWMTMQMSEWLGRSLREVVDGAALKRFFGSSASLTMPAV